MAEINERVTNLTIRQWIWTMPSEYSELVEKAFIDQGLEKHLEQYSCDGIVVALRAFRWGDTVQGSNFWSDVYELYNIGHKLPEIPSEEEAVFNVWSDAHLPKDQVFGEDTVKRAFITGIKWAREQIKNKKEENEKA